MSGTVERDSRGGLKLDWKSTKPSRLKRSLLINSHLLGPHTLSGSKDDFPGTPQSELGFCKPPPAWGWKTHAVGTGVVKQTPRVYPPLLLQWVWTHPSTNSGEEGSLWSLRWRNEWVPLRWRNE